MQNCAVSLRSGSLGLSLLVLCGGCGPATNSDSGGEIGPCDTNGARIEIGTGGASFETLGAGDPVMMVHGPQGGWHILGSIRTWNTTPIIRIAYDIRAVDEDTYISQNEYHVMLAMDEECSGYYPGMYGYLDVSPLAAGGLNEPAELLSYSSVEMSMSIEDQDGQTSSDTILVTAIPDPQDVVGDDTGSDVGD
jgi:hypothetical protein